MRILRRLLKWLGIAVLAAVVVAAIVATWLVRRAWPQTSGTVAVPGLAAPVSLLRDRWGVPQIYAANEHDLFFAQGYVHAQDRLWQMEFDRRISSGRLAEMIGAGLVPTDKYVLTLGIRRAAQRDWQLLEPETRSLLAAYAQGVNAFVAGHRGRLPVEFSLFGTDFSPWTPIDVLAWGKMTAYSLSLNAGLELLRAQLGARLGAATAARLMPPYEGPVILPSAAPEPAARTAATGAVPAPIPGDAAAKAALVPGAATVKPEMVLGATAAKSGLLEALTGAPTLGAGSNAWVVHGSRTASGKPLLVNDTHLGLAMPSVWYENGLHGGRFDVVGFSFPGVPGVLIGHNRSIAWGISSMCGDVEDVYVETRNARGQLLAPGGWYDPEVVTETIPVRGGKPVVARVVASRHGPLIGEVEELPAGSPPIALRWTAFGGGRLLDAVFALDLAQDWPAFRRALARWSSPALNFVYADTAGHIGYQAAGLIPVRAPGHDGEVPVPGATDRYEWRGYVPWDAMPSALDPASGYVVTANNKVVSESYPYHIAYDYADPYRAARIAELLAARPHLTVTEARQVQNDTMSPPAQALRPLLLTVAPASERERRALAEVRSWDLRFDPASAGATIYYVWFRRLLHACVADEVGPEFMKKVPGFPVAQTPAYVRQLAAGRRPWFDELRPPPRENRDELVRRSFREAVADLAARLGGEPSSWRWGRLHHAFLAHQPLGASGIGPLMWLFNGTPVPLPGEAFTVDANTPSYNPLRPYRVGFGVSQRLIVDLHDLGSALAVNSTGQNGELFHRHREDQIPLWGRGDYRVQPFSQAAVAAATEDRLTLAPR